MAETCDFAYYLATEIPTLPRAKYVSPPFTTGKHRLIASSMKAGPRLAYILHHKMMDYLVEIAELNDCPEIIKDIKAKRIYSESLEDLYDALTDGAGEMRILTKLIRGYGIKVRPTTINNQKKFYYGLDYLEQQHAEEESPFEEMEDDTLQA